MALSAPALMPDGHVIAGRQLAAGSVMTGSRRPTLRSTHGHRGASGGRRMADPPGETGRGGATRLLSARPGDGQTRPRPGLPGAV
jgi:hypothetical protein